MSKISYVTLGCPKNLIDSEISIKYLSDNGHEIITDLNEAEIIIVNTCTFIEEATSESISKILELSKYKSKKLKKLIVSGCMAQRYKKDILGEIPEVDFVIGTGNLTDIGEAIISETKGVRTDRINSMDAFIGSRIVQTPKSYAYLRISEGCNNACTYCIIPKLRGRYRSRDKNEILKELTNLVNNGYKEINIIAEDVTRYGIDSNNTLASLLLDMDKVEGDFNIRLLYCYPEFITDELIDVIKNSNKILHYMDIPLQHISNHILSRMNRKTTKEDIYSLLDKIQNNIPDMYLRTSLIVGFPGETQKDFEELIEFVEKFYIYNLGIFSYSREEGTRAFNFENQIDEKIKSQRKNLLMEIQNKNVKEKNENLQGENFKVIVDNISEDGLFYEARTYFQAPEIDSLTFILGLKDLKIGDKVNVVIKNVDNYDLIGEIEDELT